MDARKRTRAWWGGRAWSGRYGLRGLGQGDLEAEGLDLADVVTDLTVGVGAGLVVAVAEIGVAGGRVGQQVPVALCRPSRRGKALGGFPGGAPPAPAGLPAGAVA